eukprot:2120-Eustigmatos_ZCMA.PRE.1
MACRDLPPSVELASAATDITPAPIASFLSSLLRGQSRHPGGQHTAYVLYSLVGDTYPGPAEV